MGTRCLSCVIALALLVLMPADPAAAQTAADLFDAQTMQEIRLFINSRDLQLLRANYLENTYYPADLLWGAQRVRNAAVRSRGGGTRNPVKLGLRIDFDRYTTGQRFAGLASIVLDNLWQDPSMIRERTAMAFFDRMGQPAPRESFCRLFINNDYQGVYAIVEEVEPPFTLRTLGEDGGYLFEYHWVLPFRGTDLGEIAAYKPLFEPRNHELEPDETVYAPIREFFREANVDDAAWRERVERYLDVSQFVVHIAIENFLSENDGVLGYTGMNNLYLYRLAGTTRHRFIAWDKDNTFLQADFPIFTRVDDNVLSQRLLAFDDLRALYLETLDRCVRAAADDGWLLAEVTRTTSLVAAAAREDTRKLFGNDAFDAGAEFMKEFAAGRPAFVAGEIERARAAGR